VITAARIGRHIAEELITSALGASASFDDAEVGGQFTRGVSAGSGANGVEKHGAHVGYKTWQRPRRCGDVEYGLVLERVAANHIHVDVGAQPLPDFWMTGEKRHGALDLRPPNKTQRAFGARQLT
jgi:hypothetical protein